MGADRDPVPVPAKNIEAVRTMIEGPMRIDPWPHMCKGRQVRVRTGPLAGVEGYIVRRKHTYRLVISVDLLGRGVAAEIDAECVEAI